MKKFVLILFSSFFFLLGINAQEIFIKGGGGFNNPYAIYLTEKYTPFFATQPKVQEVTIYYEEEIPTSVYVWFKEGSEREIKETYDLGFIGDLYLFDKKYRPLTIPLFPNSKVSTIPKLPNLHCKNASISKSVTILKDSLKYDFGINCSPGQEEVSYYNPYIGTPAKYIGNISTLANKIQSSHQLASQWDDPLDSVLVFKGIISFDSILRDVELISGRKSRFSDAAQKVLGFPENKWLAANIGGRLVKAFVRIYVRLNNDGSVSIATPRRLLNASGW